MSDLIRRLLNIPTVTGERVCGFPLVEDPTMKPGTMEFRTVERKWYERYSDPKRVTVSAPAVRKDEGRLSVTVAPITTDRETIGNECSKGNLSDPKEILMSDPKEIFLQPECCADPDVGRLWCEHDAPEDCEDGKPWIRYVHADEIDRLRRELAEARGLLREVLSVGQDMGGEIELLGRIDAFLAEKEGER